MGIFCKSWSHYVSNEGIPMLWNCMHIGLKLLIHKSLANDCVASQFDPPALSHPVFCSQDGDKVLISRLQIQTSVTNSDVTVAV